MVDAPDMPSGQVVRAPVKDLLYVVSRQRRFFALVLHPMLPYATVAGVAYGVSKLVPHFGELIEFLHGGWSTWIAALPGVIIVPFLLFYASLFARVVVECWIDAISTRTMTTEGTVLLSSSTPYTYVSGRSVVSGTANQLSVGGRMFNSVPERVLKLIRPGDHLRVVHTRYLNYAITVARLEDKT